MATTSKRNTVGIVGAAAGLNFKKRGLPVRGELEYSYRTNFNYNPDLNFTEVEEPSRSTNAITSQTIMINVYYDIDTGTKFTPFVGAGIGIATNKSKTHATLISTEESADWSSSRREFAWALGGGVSYALDSHWSAEGSYRYIDLGRVSMGNKSVGQVTGDLSSHELLAALRYQF